MWARSAALTFLEATVLSMSCSKSSENLWSVQVSDGHPMEPQLGFLYKDAWLMQLDHLYHIFPDSLKYLGP